MNSQNSLTHKTQNQCARSKALPVSAVPRSSELQFQLFNEAPLPWSLPAVSQKETRFESHEHRLHWIATIVTINNRNCKSCATHACISCCGAKDFTDSPTQHLAARCNPPAGMSTLTDLDSRLPETLLVGICTVLDTPSAASLRLMRICTCMSGPRIRRCCSNISPMEPPPMPPPNMPLNILLISSALACLKPPPC